MKDLKISKELIRAVLQKETETLSKDFNFTINEDYIEFSDDGEMQFEYCIYKFAFKCKEWLIVNKIDFTIWVIDKYRFYSKKHHLDIESFSEVELIIIACEWILNEVNK